MNVVIVCLLILIIIIQFIILFYILRRRGSGSLARLKEKQASQISRGACKDLGGTDRDGRCIILTVEGNKESIMDIGKIYEED